MAKRKRIARRRYRRRGRRTFKRRKFTRRGRKTAWRPFGASRTVSLVYCDVISVNPGLGANGVYSFRCNSLFDPNYTGSGHQPYGYDTLSTLYARYMVTGAKCTASAYPGEQFQGFGLGIKVSDEPALNSADPVAIQEQPQYRYKLFGNGTRAPIPSVSKGWSLRKMVTRQKMNDEKYSATVDASPQDSWFFHVNLFPLNGVTDLSAMTLNIRITYRARFFEPRELDQS